MKKKIVITGIVLVAVVILAVVCYNIYRYPATFRRLSNQSLNEEQVNELKDEILAKADKKILVAYFSYSGTTQQVATSLSEKTGADLFEITPKNSYSNVYTQSNSEIRRGVKPALAQEVSNMDAYDIVFVGYPVWWHATPAPINSFLESYDLTGKLIIPFCTSGESDISETMPTFLDSCDGLAVFGQKRISSISQIDAWLEELQLNSSTQEIAETFEVSETSGIPETTLSELPSVDGKILIVYFSWSSSGNTEKMANCIGEQTGGDLFALEPLNPYPTDYNQCGEVAKIERDENARPEIANLPESISEYDTIFVGYPIWWHTAPMIIGTFLENYDLSGVEIYPFSQSASMDTEQFHNSMEFVRENAVGANVHDGLFVKAEDTNGIQEYLKANGFVK